MATAANYNFHQEGTRIVFTAGSVITAGQPLLVGGTIPTVSLHDREVGQECTGQTCGCFWLAKDPAEDLPQGSELWLDVADGNKAKAAAIAGNRMFGVAFNDAGVAVTKVLVKLVGPGHTR